MKSGFVSRRVALLAMQRYTRMNVELGLVKGVDHGDWSAVEEACGGAAETARAAIAGASALERTSAERTSCSGALESAGISLGEIVGWRAWRAWDGLLKSYAYAYTWLPGVTTTGSPADHGKDGFWAFKESAPAVGLAQTPYGSALPLIYGSVYMWGKVVEHESGYRAEFVQVASLDGGNERLTAGLLAELRQRYGLDPR